MISDRAEDYDDKHRMPSLQRPFRFRDARWFIPFLDNDFERVVVGIALMARGAIPPSETRGAVLTIDSTLGPETAEDAEAGAATASARRDRFGALAMTALFEVAVGLGNVRRETDDTASGFELFEVHERQNRLWFSAPRQVEAVDADRFASQEG
jgi:hypothetical protein